MKASVTSFLAAAMLLSPALNALVSASPLLVEERTPKPSCNSDNPFLNRVQYINSGYAAKLDQTIQSFLADGDKLNAARTRTVQKTVSTFVWISKYAEIDPWKKHLSEALKTQRRSPHKKLIFPMVVYNLPERDCSALASAGELSLDDDGMKKYKKYIDVIASEVDKYNDKFDFAVVLEPDSLGNIVTNLAVPKCQKAQPAYIEGLAYAIKKLQKKNVSLYIDAAHSNWLGWPANLEPSAKLYKEVLTKAGRGAKIRGFATNVSNYNAYNATTPDIIYGAGPDNPNWSELRYVQALTPFLKAEGLPAHFIIDQGRSGAQNIRLKGGHWCNIKDSGFGIRPTTKTNDCTVDALVWVKPGGESDGTSDETAVRFDENCQSPDAHIPAPEAGEWFDDFVQSLVINANPPLAPTY